MPPLKSRITYANVTATLALALVVGGGTAYAAGLAPGSVGTKQLQKSAVTTKKIAKDAVKTKKVKDGSLKLADLAVQPFSQAVTRKTDIVFPASGGGTGISKDGKVMCQDGETVLGGGYHLSSIWTQNGQPTVLLTASRPADATGAVPTEGSPAQGWYVGAIQKDNNTSTTVTVWVICGS